MYFAKRQIRCPVYDHETFEPGGHGFSRLIGTVTNHAAIAVKTLCVVGIEHLERDLEMIQVTRRVGSAQRV